MRINHNIAALNTYRQLNGATNAQGKNMERLSSGLRINRAGDDAAGLAISEKMRAQIRGLDQASSNAQDGISLIQTAEGALNETHSILQRMRELATQAATDTNVDVDRQEIQKELNQLTSEINRIGNTTQFNTRNLLNGEVNVKAGVSAKLTGAAAGNSFNIIDTATKATATGAVKTGEVELLAETGSTVTGTKTYTTDVGPNTNMTSATITGSAISGDLAISDGEGKTLTGTAVYTDPTLKNSGPNVERTSATATGTALTNDNLLISDQAGKTMTGTKTFGPDPTANNSGPNVTAGNNELTVTLNGDTKTVTLNVADYSSGGAGSAATFAADIEAKLNAGGAFGANTFSVGFDAKNQIVIKANGDNAGTPHEFSIDGGGIKDLLLNTPGTDTFTTGTQAVNNAIEITSKFANDNPDSTRVVALENAAYDLTVAGDRTALLADINDSLKAAQIFGENAISTNANLSTINAGSEVVITINDNGGGPKNFTIDDVALKGLFDGTQTAQEVADAINGLDDGSGTDFTDVAKAIVHDGKLVITSKTGALASTAQFKITDGSGGADLTALQDAFGVNDMAAAVTGKATADVVASFDTNNKLVFTSADKGAGAEVNISGGNALTSLGLDNAVEVAGTENNELVVSFDGGVTTAKISLAEADYSSGDDDSAATFAADIQTKIRALNADTLGLKGVTNAQLAAIEVTVNNDGNIMFNTKDSGVELSFTAGVASSGSVDIDTSGNDVVFNAGASGSQYNNLKIKVEADAGNAGNSASMSGDTITVKIGTGTAAGDAITTNDLQELIRGASGATVDLSNFTVSGDDGATKQDWIDQGAITLNNGSDNAGGVESLLKAAPSDAYQAGTEKEVNNEITLTAQGLERTITLSDANYDLDTEAGQNSLVADIQTQLDTAFSAGVVTASFDNGGLVFTNSVDGTTSTFGATVTGNGAAALGLNSAEVVQGGEFNKLTVTYEGQTETLDLAMENYDGSAGKTTDDFLADMQSKLNTAFGAGNITVELDNANKIMFTTKAAGEEISVDGGGAVKHLLAGTDTISDLEVNLSGEVDRTMTLTVGANTGTIELNAGNYDLGNADNRQALLDDINGKLGTAFGEGAVTASFAAGETGYSLVLTNNTEGSGSTIETNITGGAAAALGMVGAQVSSGVDTNNEAQLTIDGKTVNINLAGGTYTGAEMAKEIQNQIRVQGVVGDDAATLEDAKVSFDNGTFSIQSGAKGASGSVAATGILGDNLGLTSSQATTTAGVDAIEESLKLQIGANTGQSMSIDINDMRASALGVTSESADAPKTVEVDGKQYTVAWTQSESVTNGTDNNEVEFALDVSSHDNATAAVKVINDAIEAVSAERSKLGAFQNRLEHTINNLGTSSENLTAAESRIRDVDMAKEIMESTKNGILSQAAQAMLAQANQQPQGVLQLLR